MEKRAWKRISVELSARCRAVEDTSYKQVKIVDIHHQGCCLKSAWKYFSGQEVRIVVTTPSVGDIYVSGEVVWTGQDEGDGSYRAGVRFDLNTPVAEETSNKLYLYYTQQGSNL